MAKKIVFTSWSGFEIDPTTDETLHYKNTVTGDREFIEVCATPLEHCCGIVELGDLSISPNFEQVVFNKIMKSIIYKGQIFIINTNGKKHSIIFEKLLRNCRSFKLVKQFINASSGNKIKVWISTNK